MWYAFREAHFGTLTIEKKEKKMLECSIFRSRSLEIRRKSHETRAVRKKSIDTLCVRSPEKFSFIVRCRDLDYHFLSTFIPDITTRGAVNNRVSRLQD